MSDGADYQAKVRLLLRERIGLDESSIGTATLDRGITRAMKAADCASIQDFWGCLDGKPAAVQQLIEEVVVPETWFFREPAALLTLQTTVVQQWLRSKQTKPLRVLSIPCATGEEPYSIAISLMEVLGDPAKFSVDAVDISERSIEKARKGEYSSRAFRGQDLAKRRQFLEKSAAGYRVVRAIRARVNFRTGNLLVPDLQTSGPYDCIFCRNVLIYFDRVLKESVAASFDRMLAPHGLIVVAAAEAAWLSDGPFEPLPQTPFAFRKREVTAKQPPSNGRSSAPHTSPKPTEPRPSGSVPRTPVNPHPLDLARAEADAGRLREAAEQCQQYLQSEDTSAEAHYLLGQLQDAGGDCTAAIACYRRALYLDPNHLGALKQLALLHEKRGELRASRQWATRLDRLQRSST